MARVLLAGGASVLLMGAALLLPVAMAHWEGRELTWLGIGMIAAGCLMMACGMVALGAGFRQRRGSTMPSGIRATVAANVMFLAFLALELSDRLIRQEGKVFYWTTFLFLPAGLLLCGLIAAQRWAWWISRLAFGLGTLWFLGFLAVIPFAPLQTDGVPVPWYGRFYTAGITVAFAGIMGFAYWSLGQPGARRYFGLLRSEESGAAADKGA